MWLIEQYLGTKKTHVNSKLSMLHGRLSKQCEAFGCALDGFFHYVDLRVKINHAVQTLIRYVRSLSVTKA